MLDQTGGESVRQMAERKESAIAWPISSPLGWLFGRFNESRRSAFERRQGGALRQGAGEGRRDGSWLSEVKRARHPERPLGPAGPQRKGAQYGLAGCCLFSGEGGQNPFPLASGCFPISLSKPFFGCEMMSRTSSLPQPVSVSALSLY